MRMDVGYLVKSLNDKLEFYANADMAKLGLTFTQSRVLMILHDAGGEMTQKELEIALEVSHPTVVGLVSRMKRAGFLGSRQDERDHRNKIIFLTDKARAVGKMLDEAVRDHNRKMLEGLTREQVEEFYKTMQLIYKNVSQ